MSRLLVFAGASAHVVELLHAAMGDPALYDRMERARLEAQGIAEGDEYVKALPFERTQEAERLP
jgi:hypothetical protein